MIYPAKILPNKRIVNEIGNANSPMTFNGVNKNIGSVNSFIRANNPPFLIPLPWIINHIVTANVALKLTLLVGF